MNRQQIIRLSAFIAKVLRQNTNIMATIFDLPQELWDEILQHLNLRDLHALIDASDEFRYRVQESNTWKAIRKAMLEDAITKLKAIFQRPREVKRILTQKERLEYIYNELRLTTLVRKARYHKALLYKTYARRAHKQKAEVNKIRIKIQKWKMLRNQKLTPKIESDSLPDCLFHCFERCI